MQQVYLCVKQHSRPSCHALQATCYSSSSSDQFPCNDSKWSLSPVQTLCSGGGYHLRALCLSLLLRPTLLELSRFLHHQHLMCAFLNILLCHFEHAMQFIELLIHAVDMIVRDERAIARRKRTQNCICSPLIQEREAQPIPSLHISDHLDNMWA